MRREILFGAIAAACMAGFTSCDNDDNPEAKPEVVETLAGLYVVNNGNQGGNIPGSITSYDYASGKTTQDVFFSTNGYALGDMPQSAMVYGDKMYITVAKSNILWICDAKTVQVLGSVKFEGEVSEPRYLTNHNGKVYVSLYSGHVAQIDTLTMKQDKVVKVGPNPEQMAVANGKLYVANSDGMNYKEGYVNGYVSVVDLATMNESRLDIALNPVEVRSNGKEVVVLCKGNYADVPSQAYKLTDKGGTMICDATIISMRDDELYIINAPYGQEITDYDVYSVSTGKKLRSMVKEGVDYPAGLDVDPLTGNIVILSYTLDASGYAQYREPGYGRIYDNEGNPLARFDTGVGSTWVTFLHQTEVK